MVRYAGLTVTLAALTASAPCYAQVSPGSSAPGEKEITIMVLRDSGQGEVCVDYAWIPEGHRRVIRLKPKQQSSGQMDKQDLSGKNMGQHKTEHDDTSQINIHQLSIPDQSAGIKLWQFPKGSPYSSAIIGAVIQIFQDNKTAIGTVYFADGAVHSETRQINDKASPCSG